ncbi:RNA polymerase sigma factor [Geodermatophilus sabuli]|uniref:RNA polymerase sigma factor, sigma-70 family n=1 Tax=Geodermatophilus sabuli TaxID=1564158 RepID=A0A285EBX4_9ACTN|nr:sigma-70 family RNA polymerase sigma factor [Geodermatophilus sabuli]MBB3084379.1 RNA polymerase sigma factor (sigma-70 family) [Geodermatophilus sabuli]SNX96353.1 RNA polymerase sigma factor, sigma-70 family [Geodermatophilus sabuli]
MLQSTTSATSTTAATTTWDEEDTQCRPAATRVSDPAGWEALVAEHQRYLLRVASSYRLGEEAHDVVQTAWLRLLEQGDGIRDWEAVRAWLTTVVRRECLRIIRGRRRERLCGPDESGQLENTVDDSPTAEDLLVRGEDQQLVRRAMRLLPPRQHDLLEALSDPEAPEYAVIGRRLGMPVGSMGPTRQRGLRRLRATLTDMGLDMCG